MKHETFAINENGHEFFIHTNERGNKKELLLSTHTNENPVWIMNTDFTYGNFYSMTKDDAANNAQRMADIANVTLAIEEHFETAANERYMDVDEYVELAAKSKSHVTATIPYPDESICYSATEFMNLWVSNQETGK